MKRHIIRIKGIQRIVMALTVGISALTVSAQQLQTVYTVQKGETLFGISKRYGVTIQEIARVNPAMQNDNYVLSVGTKLNIPVHDAAVSEKMVRVGVMLPLHDINGDGRRMTEYYRGMLLALNDLKAEGINVEMNTWNVPEDGDVSAVLADSKAKQNDVIFGPLYTKQVPEMAQFCKEHNIRLVIPFSINGSDVQTCPNVYQVYQTPQDINKAAIKEFVRQFSGCHPVFVDCNDETSTKGGFTTALRDALYKKGVKYSITNMDNDIDLFAKAFVQGEKNVVVLNTGRSPELGKVIAQLDRMSVLFPAMKIVLFGYNEWFMYDKVYREKLHKYEAYIPSVYDFDDQQAAVQSIEQKYQTYFGQPMMKAIPRFAITGYDQLMFFVKGINQFGSQFHGLSTQNCYRHIQTSLSFEKLPNGGYQNRKFVMVRK